MNKIKLYEYATPACTYVIIYIVHVCINTHLYTHVLYCLPPIFSVPSPQSHTQPHVKPI